MRTPAIVLALSTAAATAHAGGFILNDHGAKATGRADAVVATVEDGSSIFYNPAGIGIADGINVYVGATLIDPNVSFTDADTGNETDSTTPMAVTPTFYAHGQISDVVKVGIGFYTPFGSSTKWPASSPGRDQSRETVLRTFFISPVVGFDLSKYVPGTLAFGGGFDLVPATVLLKRDILFGADVGTAELGGDGLGFGGRAGVRYDPISQVSIGLTYRSEVKIDFDGQADFDAGPQYRPILPPDGDISTEVTLPQSVLGGVAYRPMPNVELELDFNWIDWTSFKQLDIALPDGSTLTDPRNWDDVLVVRFGAEYMMPQFGANVRAGYAYDPTPIPDTTLGFAPPDANRHVVSIGGSYQLPQNFYVDLGLLYGIPVSNTTSDEPFEPQVKGKFDISFLNVALSLGYHFDVGGGTPTPAAAATVARN